MSIAIPEYIFAYCRIKNNSYNEISTKYNTNENIYILIIYGGIGQVMIQRVINIMRRDMPILADNADILAVAYELLS